MAIEGSINPGGVRTIHWKLRIVVSSYLNSLLVSCSCFVRALTAPHVPRGRNKFCSANPYIGDGLVQAVFRCSEYRENDGSAFHQRRSNYSDGSMSRMLDRSNCATTSEQSIFNHFCFTLDRTIDDCGLRGTFIWFARDEKIAFHALLFHT